MICKHRPGVVICRYLKVPTNAIAMKRLRWCIVQAQKAAKAFLECKKARIHSLFRVWIKCERKNRSKILKLQKAQNNKKASGNNLENIVDEKKRYQKLRAIAFTNDTAETRWKKTLRDPNGSLIDPVEANEVGKLIATHFENAMKLCSRVLRELRST